VSHDNPDRPLQEGDPSRRDPDKVDRIKVQVAPLKDILSTEEIGCALLKVDTEGYEYKVFSGLDADTRLIFDYIIFEYSAESLRRAGVEPVDLLRLECFCHYDLYSIAVNGSITECEIKDICAAEEMAGNYLLVKKDVTSLLDSVF